MILRTISSAGALAMLITLIASTTDTAIYGQERTAPRPW